MSWYPPTPLTNTILPAWMTFWNRDFIAATAPE
jgi:hypothetical protein